MNVTPLLSSFGFAGGWAGYLSAAVLVMVRVSGLMVFSPMFSSAAISPRVKVAFAIAVTMLIAPAVSAVPGVRATLDGVSLMGELGVGFVFGITLSLLSEALVLAGWLLGMEFSFSLVNLIDPNSMVETPVLGQLLGLLGVLILIGAGLDRSLLAALVRSFCTVPLGTAMLTAKTAGTVASMGAGIFLAGLQLAAPVMAAALAVDVSTSLISRLAPQVPAMLLGIPAKTLVAYVVLISSLAVWPGWVEGHFTALLRSAESLLVKG